MGLFDNSIFFIYVGILAIPAIVLGLLERPIKYYGMVATLIVLWLSLGASSRATLYLVIYIAFESILIKSYLVINSRFKRSAGLYWIFLAFAISPLAIYKVGGLFGYSIFGFLGISYMTFKAVQIVIEIYDDVIKEVSALEFIYLCLFFPTISSGPIDRSRRFEEDLNHTKSREEYIVSLSVGLAKIVQGAVYKFVIAAILYQLMNTYGMDSTVRSAAAYMYSYGFYLFFDFAGYSLMAVGVSYLFGIEIPDNFNKPFISKDIKEFWNRWHITLSYWFRDFIFSRLMVRFIKKKYFKTKLSRASAAFIINMTIMGVWHGLTSYYICYGMYHGVLLALTEVYQKKSAFHKAHKKKRWYTFLTWLVTFNLIMLGFFIFSGRLTELLFGVSK